MGTSMRRTIVLEVLLRLGPGVLMLVLFVAAWDVAVTTLHVPVWEMPPPHLVLHNFVSDWRMWMNDTGMTLFESVLGFSAGGVFGISVGMVFAHFRLLERLLYPYAIALKTIPLVALAPILAIWFPNGMIAKVLMGAIITFFPCVVNTVMGLRSASPEALDLMRSLSASPFQIFRMLRLPSALPGIFSALKISSTLAVIGAIVAEMAGAEAGLGHRLILAEERTDMATMVTAVILASLGGIVFFQAISILERRVLYWIPPGGE